MIARELIVKLGFNIDFVKFEQFNKMTDHVKAKMSTMRDSVQKSLSPNISSFLQDISAYKNELQKISQDQKDDILSLNRLEKESIRGLTEAEKEHYKIIKNLREKQAKPQNSNRFTTIINEVKTKVKSVKARIQNSMPTSATKNTGQWPFYKNEAKNQTKVERSDILSLNNLEKQGTKETLAAEREKYNELKTLENEHAQIKKSNQERLNNLLRAGNKIAKIAAGISLAVTTGFFASLKTTLRDVENYQEGKKTPSIFSSQQIQAVKSFNASINAMKTTLAELRNRFVIALLPAIQKNIEALNKWFTKNKEIINSKLKSFIDSVSKVFGTLFSAISKIVEILSPLISLIGGWEKILIGIMGIALVGWLYSISTSLYAAATAFGVLTAASLKFLSSPMGLLLSAFTLLADEINIAKQGGDSFINDFLKSDSFQLASDSIQKIIADLKKLWQWLIQIKDIVIDLPSKAFNKISTFFTRDHEQVSRLSSLYNDERLESFRKMKEKQGFIITTLDLDEVGGEVKVKTELPTLQWPQNSNFRGFDLPRYSPEDIARTSNNYSNTTQNKQNSVSNKNYFNMSINVPEGTTLEQSQSLIDIVKRQLEAHTKYEHEKTLNAIGAF